MSTTKFLSIVLLCAASATAQPKITGGPVNAASYIGPGRPNSSIAQGSMFIVFGQNMGPANLVQINSLPVPATLGGTSIRVTVGGTTVNALMIYSSGGQVAAVLPSNAATGDGTLTLTFNNQTSAPAPIRVIPSSFGMFTRNSGGSGPAIVQNFISQTQQPTNGLIAAAQPGQTVILWGTGLGPVAGNEAAAPLPGDLGVPVDVYVGNQPAIIAYRGRSGCCVGIDQIVFTVPPGVEGCYIPVAVRAGGVTGNIGTMSIKSASNVCSDPMGFSPADLAKVQSNSPITVADIALTRAQASLNFPGLGTGSGTFEYAESEFKNYRALDLLAANRGGVGGFSLPANTPLPTVGCTISQFGYKNLFQSIIPSGGGDGTANRELDAGVSINITGAAGTQKLPRNGTVNSFEYYPSGILGGSFTGTLPGLPTAGPLFFNPGSFTIDDGSGGADIGAFKANVTVPASTLTWTNQDSFTNVPRSQDLQLTWSGGSANVAVFGSSADPNTNALTAFTCVAPAGASQMTVPSWVLGALPASGLSSEGARVGYLSIATVLSQPVRFQASGVDAGFINWAQSISKNVVYQ
jgi:uncharacterized protein (TIGR03437 family)